MPKQLTVVRNYLSVVNKRSFELFARLNVVICIYHLTLGGCIESCVCAVCLLVELIVCGKHILYAHIVGKAHHYRNITRLRIYEREKICQLGAAFELIAYAHTVFARSVLSVHRKYARSERIGYLTLSADDLNACCIRAVTLHLAAAYRRKHDAFAAPAVLVENKARVKKLFEIYLRRIGKSAYHLHAGEKVVAALNKAVNIEILSRQERKHQLGILPDNRLLDALAKLIDCQHMTALVKSRQKRSFYPAL